MRPLTWSSQTPAPAVTTPDSGGRACPRFPRGSNSARMVPVLCCLASSLDSLWAPRPQDHRLPPELTAFGATRTNGVRVSSVTNCYTCAPAPGSRGTLPSFQKVPSFPLTVPTASPRGVAVGCPASRRRRRPHGAHSRPWAPPPHGHQVSETVQVVTLVVTTESPGWRVPGTDVEVAPGARFPSRPVFPAGPGRWTAGPRFCGGRPPSHVPGPLQVQPGVPGRPGPRCRWGLPATCDTSPCPWEVGLCTQVWPLESPFRPQARPR